MTFEEFEEMFEQVQQQQSPLNTRQEHYVDGVLQTATSITVAEAAAQLALPESRE